jgi:hypothetical protein
MRRPSPCAPETWALTVLVAATLLVPPPLTALRLRLANYVPAESGKVLLEPAIERLGSRIDLRTQELWRRLEGRMRQLRQQLRDEGPPRRYRMVKAFES